jgi:hypothetical protein
MGSGGHIVAANALLWVPAGNLLSYTMPRFGIETTLWMDVIRSMGRRDSAQHPPTVWRDRRQLGPDVLNIPARSDCLSRRACLDGR